MEEQTTLSTRF